MAPQPSDPRVEAVLAVLDELPIHAAQHDIDDAAMRIVEIISAIVADDEALSHPSCKTL